MKTQIAGFSFDNCTMNAAGVACMTVEELEAVRKSSADTFVTKPATLASRQGNPDPRYHDVPLGSINSMGLPNQGIDYYLAYLLSLQEARPERAFFLSLVGISPAETYMLLKKVQNSGFNGITELNLSCPNVPGKPQIASDFETTECILSGA
ncbi:dihydroorotate oxidase, partial [Neisseria sp. P0022.S006]